ncbi:hypothetical protein LTR10_023905 [Elasticomyces elasticus]|uniref:Uncharacterized protein n=1 Tax=Exophiala sideris TaxID=1016849 RepID=A0ABR0IUZ4_9EURO|nr:hypothetical protein LTR10_023905 [Elasticomyces elasticus]KAK5020885.1 hypothetical protein LTS07_011387 [Exophiala sideris]KAK5023010.1 hypothetical protein LTR13_011356 [Exophiala sideris]KAK5048403.1 hypothetical protein LTR69_011391 [Exophiala sideris]KAK5176091.1 hypothetical protein LTR44_011366 [Eurotiomycetes sp. CCFEE 6388]
MRMRMRMLIQPRQKGLEGDIYDRPKALFCDLDPEAVSTGVKSSPTRLVCYGTVLNVEFDSSTKPTQPIEKFANLFISTLETEPVSIGATPLDAMLTFLQAHHANEDSVLGTGSSSAAEDILTLSELLYASEDSYNSRVKGADLTYAHNFRSSPGGNAWHYDDRNGPEGAPAEPSRVPAVGSEFSELNFLEQLDRLQLQCDAANRKLTFTRWSMFAMWWMFVSDPENTDPTRRARYRARLSTLRGIASDLVILINDADNGLILQIENIAGLDRSAMVSSLHRVGSNFLQRSFGNWSVQILNSPVGNIHDQVRYGIPEVLSEDEENSSDQRMLSGRVILTPTPSENLYAVVAQVLDMAATKAPSDMGVGELLEQPNPCDPGIVAAVLIQAPLKAAVDAGFTMDDFRFINDESGFTPYGNLVDFSNAL